MRPSALISFLMVTEVLRRRLGKFGVLAGQLASSMLGRRMHPPSPYPNPTHTPNPRSASKLHAWWAHAPAVATGGAPYACASMRCKRLCCWMRT